MRRLLTLVYILIGLLVLGGNANAQDVVKVGVDLEMTGAVAAFGQMTWTGIQIAHEMQPTVLGKKVKLVLGDNKSDKIEAANVAQRLIKKDHVVAIIGAVASSHSLAIAPICEENHVPQITPSSTNPLVTQNRKWVFRACFIDPFQGDMLAKFAVNYLHAKTAAVLTDIAQDYSVGLSNFFIKKFTQLGGKVVSHAFYQTGDQDFTAQLTAIKKLHPDVIVIPGYYTEIALIARQARELGIKSTLLAGDGAEAPELVKIGGKAVEGLYYSTHFDEKAAETELGKKYVKIFRKKYHKAPDALGALGFDAYMLLMDAIKRAGSTDPAKIRDALDQTKNFEGVTGIITLVNGNAVKSGVIRVVKNGKFVYVTTIKPD